MRVVIIPDAHAMPYGSPYGNERFTWLGRFVGDVRPDLVVCVGDWADMPSLSGHDPCGSIQLEGQRYTDDVAGSVDALERFEKGTGSWTGRKVITLGNHEVRPDRAAATDARLYGTLSSKDLQFEDHGWEVIPFLQPFWFEGIRVQHYFQKVNGRQPFGGPNAARQILADARCSCIAGHNHLYTYEEHVSKDRNHTRTFAMTVGCYGHRDYGQIGDIRTDWARTSAFGWWRGVFLMETDGRGYWNSLSGVRQDLLEAQYG